MVFLSCAIIIILLLVYVVTNKINYALVVLLVLFGFFQIYFGDKNYESKYANIEDEVKVKAIIIKEAEEKEYKYTYTINVEEINGDKKYNNTKLILNLKKSDKLNNMPKFGDEIEVVGKIEKPSEARNYKGFDYKAYLKSKKIYGTMETKKIDILNRNKSNYLDKCLNSVQNSIKENMNKILKEDESALAVGILIGARSDISEEVENNFKMSSLTHMLAVSGSHITYIVSAFTLILGKINKKATKVFTISFLIFFMALTGFTASVIRATIMGIIILLASLLFRKSDTVNNLCIAAFIILIFNPYTITDLGFLLSFAGTIGIISLGNTITDTINKLIYKVSKGKINVHEKAEVKQENCSSIMNEVIKNRVVNSSKKTNEDNKIIVKILKYIINSISITLSANIIIMPIMAYSFSTVSFTFWISNILAGPIMEVVTILGFVVYFISLISIQIAQVLGILLNFLLSSLSKIAEISSSIPGALIYVKTPYIYECLIYYLVVVIILNLEKIKNTIKIINCKYEFVTKFKKRIKVNIIVILILTITIKLILNFFPNSLKIYFIDVGQGDCTLIITPYNKNILIDGGGSEFGNFDVGENIVLPYLLDRKVNIIDYLLISHFDSDHIGGLFYVMENLKIKNIIISKQGKETENLKKLKKIIQDKKINLIIVKKGDVINIDKISNIEILFPERNLINENIINNNSIVAQFKSLDFKMLFTGDIEAIAEEKIVELYNNSNKLESTVIKIAHHGSKSSSTKEFLDRVKAKIAVIGVGEDNNFGHPNQEVLQRIINFGIRVYRTDMNGEIILIYKNGKIKVNTMY